MVAAGDGERGEEGGVGARPAVLPGDARDGPLECGDLAAQAAGQHLFQLGQCAQGRLLDPGESTRSGAQGDGDGDGLLVVEEERWQIRTGGLAVAAAVTASAVDGVAHLPQPVDVAAYGAHGHPEPAGQVEAGPFPPGLQQGEQTQPVGSLVMHSTMPGSKDRSCPEIPPR